MVRKTIESRDASIAETKEYHETDESLHRKVIIGIQPQQSDVNLVVVVNIFVSCTKYQRLTNVSILSRYDSTFNRRNLHFFVA